MRLTTQRCFQKVIRVFLLLYQKTFSPLFTVLFGQRCRFYPSCSNYALKAIELYPAPESLIKISRRLCKCGPWHPGGIDFP